MKDRIIAMALIIVQLALIVLGIAVLESQPGGTVKYFWYFIISLNAIGIVINLKTLLK